MGRSSKIMRRRTGNEQELAGSKWPSENDEDFAISLSIVGGLLFLLLLKTVTEDRAA